MPRMVWLLHRFVLWLRNNARQSWQPWLVVVSKWNTQQCPICLQHPRNYSKMFGHWSWPTKSPHKRACLSRSGHNMLWLLGATQSTQIEKTTEDQFYLQISPSCVSGVFEIRLRWSGISWSLYELVCLEELQHFIFRNSPGLRPLACKSSGPSPSSSSWSSGSLDSSPGIQLGVFPQIQ